MVDLVDELICQRNELVGERLTPALGILVRSTEERDDLVLELDEPSARLLCSSAGSAHGGSNGIHRVANRTAVVLELPEGLENHVLDDGSCDLHSLPQSLDGIRETIPCRGVLRIEPLLETGHELPSPGDRASQCVRHPVRGVGDRSDHALGQIEGLIPISHPVHSVSDDPDKASGRSNSYTENGRENVERTEKD